MGKNNIVIRKNERSWAIEIISEINAIAKRYDLIIKKAGGELTISSSRKQRMFPDVLLYSDENLMNILQGWELKMPDVAITDNSFLSDAQRKARALNLSSFVVWNFTYARIYIQNNLNNEYELAGQWENPAIVTRDDVASYKKEWSKTLEEVVLFVNNYLITNSPSKISIGKVISECAIHMLINSYKSDVARYIKNCATYNTIVEADVDIWWEDVKLEYKFDEEDKYTAYAKTIIINWVYRIIFAHLIKHHQQYAFQVDEIDYNTTPSEANLIFIEITKRCDFYNVFGPMKWCELMPTTAWYAIVELSLFIRENGITTIKQSTLQKILENSIEVSRREINGQFATPKSLARIMAKITVHDWHEDVGDPCCGSGTIPHAILELKREKIGIEQAVASTWASDKYSLPLQIANLSLVSYDTINLANRIFQRNAFELEAGAIVKIVNPQSGVLQEVKIPTFGAICTNLPFVASEKIRKDDLRYIENGTEYSLDRKSDLSYYITLHLGKLLKAGGYLGIIISNSWLGTSSGNKFYAALKNEFHLKQVHISGSGKWFDNADVVTTLMLLQKKSSEDDGETAFYIWKCSLDQISNDDKIERAIVNSSILNRVVDEKYLTRSSYSSREIDHVRSMNLSYNALFHNIGWVIELRELLIPVTELFDVIRGSRRGWDPLFFPKETNEIERNFLFPALFNAKNVTSLIAKADRFAFCCNENYDTLQRDYPKAYKWIRKFENLKNGKQKPLPEVLKIPDGEWYELKAKEVVDIFTMMNPDKRIFFGRFETPTFINQRLIGLKRKRDYAEYDIELCHALLNSILMKFFVEAVGFGRGLGVLDINKAAISKCFMLNPKMIDEERKTEIKRMFRRVVNFEIGSVEEELANREWVDFNITVLRSFNIEGYFSKIVSSLLSLREIRSTATGVNRELTLLANFYNERENTIPIAAEPAISH